MFFWPEICWFLPTRCSSESSDNPFTFVKVELLAAVHLATTMLSWPEICQVVPRDAGARAEIIHSERYKYTRWYAQYTLRLNFPTLNCPKLLFIVLQVRRKVGMGSEARLLVNNDNSCEYDYRSEQHIDNQALLARKSANFMYTETHACQSFPSKLCQRYTSMLFWPEICWFCAHRGVSQNWT